MAAFWEAKPVLLFRAQGRDSAMTLVSAGILEIDLFCRTRWAGGASAAHGATSARAAR